VSTYGDDGTYGGDGAGGGAVITVVQVVAGEASFGAGYTAQCANPPRLVDPALGALVFAEEDGWFVKSIDVPSPEIRAVNNPRPDADGEDDTTTFHGARAVVLSARLIPEDRVVRRSMLDALNQFLRPAARPYLYVTEDPADPTERRIRLRIDQWSQAFTRTDLRDVQVSWRAPDGVWEAGEETVASIAAAASGTEQGVSFDITPDLTFPASPTIGAAQVTNAGNTDVFPLLRLYGPCTNPKLENRTVGRTLEFSGLTVAAGEFLEVDTDDKTIRYLGNANDNRYHRLNFATSTWWGLIPGVNELRYYPLTFTEPALAEVAFRHRWM
jgi:hypothetical protein